MSSRLALAALASLVTIAVYVVAPGPGSRPVAADVAGVTANVPQFLPGQLVTITVTAEDDDGVLVINSNLNGSTLSVLNCSGVGANQVAGKCDGSGIAAVSGQGTKSINLDTTVVDNDTERELLTVTLTLIASCTTATTVTVSADQPGNVGPDDVTINCVPPTNTPTPTATPTSTPVPTSTPLPNTPLPPPTVISEVLGIRPPNTGDAGIARR